MYVMGKVKRIRGRGYTINDIGCRMRVGGFAGRGDVDAMPGWAMDKPAAVGLEAAW